MTLTLPPYPTEYLDVNFLNGDVQQKDNSKIKQILPFAISEIFNSQIISKKLLTQGEDVKPAIEICVNIEGINYKPGYTFGILPKNNINEVNKLINRLNFIEIADKIFTVSEKPGSKKKKPPHIPVSDTIRNVFIYNLDIRTAPKKLFLRALHKYTTAEDDLKLLDELCSREGSHKYTAFISEYMPLLELLNKIPSCFPPLSVFLEHLPRLLPRPYSVTSSPKQFDSPSSKANFILNLTELPKNYKGVCSNFIFDQKPNQIIQLYLRKPNEFILPDNHAINLILIATGTGIAPFMSFLHENKLEDNKRQIWLFYGCRYSQRDFLCKDDIEGFLKIGLLTKLFTSFSRESLGPKIKYVQDNIRLNANDFVDFLLNDTKLYVCGGRKMSTDVFETICSCIEEVKKCSPDDAKSLVNELKKSHKYIEDIWN